MLGSICHKWGVVVPELSGQRLDILLNSLRAQDTPGVKNDPAPNVDGAWAGGSLHSAKESESSLNGEMRSSTISQCWQLGCHSSRWIER